MATVAEAPAEAIIPDPTTSDAEVSQKRKASSVSVEPEEPSKRPRTEEEDDHRDPPAQEPKLSPPYPKPRDADASAGAGAARRAPLSKEEEKKRGKRLFGGLLSTLSQTNTSSQQKKRREIEQRQQERAQKQRADDEKRRNEKAAKIKEARWQQQISLDEKIMRTRHDNMLAMAHSFKTKAEPHIYYRPWKPTKVQQEALDDQIQEAKATIAREVAAFKDRLEEHERRYGRSSPRTSQEQPAPPAESSAEAPPAPEAPLADTAPAADTNTVSSHDRDTQDREPHDESVDVVEDAEEDMVIY